MATQPRIKHLRIYPIKSLCPVDLTEAEFQMQGLAHDREWAVVDAKGYYVMGKVKPAVHKIRLLEFKAPSTVTLKSLIEPDQPSFQFDLIAQHDEAEAWFQTVFENPNLRLIRRPSGEAGYLDDPHFDGPSIVSEGTLRKIEEWMNVNDAMDRFRPNVVVEGVEPFWEDLLLDDDAENGSPITFGNVELIAAFPIHRCVVPSRVPSTSPNPGKPDPEFIKKFQEKRREFHAKGSPVKRLTGATEKGREAHFLATACLTLKPGTVSIGDPVISKPKVPIQPLVKKYRPNLSKRKLQRMVDAFYMLQELPKKERLISTFLIQLLPLELAALVVTSSRPATVRRPTTSDVIIGIVKLLVGFLLVVTLLRWAFKI